MTAPPSNGAVEPLLKSLAPRVLGVVVRRFGDFAAAEDAVQEALLAAFTQWPVEGLPANPGGWLTQVAARRLLDQRRSDRARRLREESAAAEGARHAGSIIDPDAYMGSERDDTLTLLFMCCHPVLTDVSAIALALRAVGGLTTSEIARAFLVPEATMAQRISRAKQSIRTSAARFELPEGAERAPRLAAVLHILYLIFNEGYASSTGAGVSRVELSSEAIRLARLLHRELPDQGEVAGLLALMLLTDARRAARTGPLGQLIPLDEQDRSLWDRAAIAEGIALLTAAKSCGSVGAYRIQASIAALHDEAPSFDRTDWAQILALYGLLMSAADSPVVRLNHAIAAAMVHGPAHGLELLKALDGDVRMEHTHRRDAARAHLLERMGDASAAIQCYRAAAARTASLPERHYLLLKAETLARQAGRSQRGP